MCQTNLDGLLGTRVAKIVRRISIFSVLASAAIVASPLLDDGAIFAQEEGIEVGSTAPNASLQTLDGRPVELNQFLGKKPVVMEFWATWCPVCKSLQPRIDAAIKKHGAAVTFITLAVSANQTPARVAAWHKANPIATEMLYDAKGSATGAYDPPATSYLVIINKAGKVVYTGLGANQDVEGAIQKALK
jgi:thiol-disulfide isomerase/thioredoxin